MRTLNEVIRLLHPKHRNGECLRETAARVHLEKAITKIICGDKGDMMTEDQYDRLQAFLKSAQSTPTKNIQVEEQQNITKKRGN